MNEMMDGKLILVTGATGRQGGASARHLLRRGFRVRALTRDPARPAGEALRDMGAEVVRGDLDDEESVRGAVEGVYGVFSVQNFWETGYQREIDQGCRLAEAARDAGVEHFVYSSVASASRGTGLEHFESKWVIESRVRELGLPYTILRPVFFMSNWENPPLKNAILRGTFAVPLEPETRLQQVAADDVGAFTAMAFSDRGRWIGREVDLAGDEPTMLQVAETFGRVIGRPVEYLRIPWDEYRKRAGEEYYRMYRWFQDVGYEADIPALRAEYPDLTTFEQYLRGAGWEGATASEHPPDGEER